MVAANAARYAANTEELQGFVEATGLPIFTVEQARGMVPDGHPLCFGYADAALNHAARHFREADAVLLLGKRLDHRYRYGMSPYFHDEAKIIQIDPDPHELGRNRGVCYGDSWPHRRRRRPADGSCAWHKKWKNLSAWTATLAASREAQLRAMEGLATEDAPLHPVRVFKELKPFIDDDTVLVFDGGDFVQWGRSYLSAEKTGRWLRLGPLSHLGFGLPYALAARLAHPSAKVFLMMGDGSLGFYAMEYDTALRHNLPFVTILGNDATWSIDKNFQLAYFGRAVATDLRPMRYDRVVEAIGGHGDHVASAAEMAPAVRRALDSGKPSLIDITINPAQSPLADAMIARRQGARR